MLARRLTLVVAAAVTVGVLAGCGSKTAAPAGPPDLVVKGSEMKFDQTSYSLPAGRHIIEFANDGQMSHSMVVFRRGAKSQLGGRNLIAPKASIKASYQLSPGTYDLICDVAGHAQQGMVATLQVT